jgi:environmental stress-induced protein Ves
MNDLKLTIVRSSEQKAANWAGGTTTQLFISPQNTTYQAFDFDYRMSYATVEIPESTFTRMPGVTRHLMMLKGSIDLNHEGRLKHLDPLEPYEFNGEWPTTAKGKVMDFNLMVRNGYKGKLSTIELQPNETIQIEPISPILGIYSFQGAGSLHINQEKINLDTGDFFHLLNNETITLSNTNECSTFILAKVWKP